MAHFEIRSVNDGSKVKVKGEYKFTPENVVYWFRMYCNVEETWNIVKVENGKDVLVLPGKRFRELPPLDTENQ